MSTVNVNAAKQVAEHTFKICEQFFGNHRATIEAMQNKYDVRLALLEEQIDTHNMLTARHIENQQKIEKELKSCSCTLSELQTGFGMIIKWMQHTETRNEEMTKQIEIMKNNFDDLGKMIREMITTFNPPPPNTDPILDGYWNDPGFV